jgi:hypothetical protein
MESAKAIQNFIGPVLEKYRIDLSLPLLMVRFQDNVGNKIAILRFEDNALFVLQSFEEDDWRDTIEIGLCVQGNDWIPRSYGKGRYFLNGAEMSNDGAGLDKVKPRKMKKVAKKCEAWVNEIVKGNDCYDCLTPTMMQYQENRQWVRKFYAVCR